VADEPMTNRDFLQIWKTPEQGKIFQIEIVARVDAEAKRMGKLRGVSVDLEARFATSCFECPRERLRVQFNAIASDRSSPISPRPERGPRKC
jgi:hypothetical protein